MSVNLVPRQLICLTMLLYTSVELSLSLLNSHYTILLCSTVELSVSVRERERERDLLGIKL